MALNANALATLDEVKAYLRLVGGSDDALLEEGVNTVSEWMETYLGFVIKRRQFTGYRMRARCGTDLRAPGAPIDVTQTVTITVDDVAQTVWRTDADGLASGFDVVVDSDVDDPIWRPNIFHRRAGWDVSGTHPSPIKLTYLGGFSPVPKALLDAFFNLMSKYHREVSKGLQDMVSVNSPAGTTTFPDRYLPAAVERTLNHWRGFRV